MCLILDIDKTNNFKRFNRQKAIICYKVVALRPYSKDLVSPWHCEFKWKIGWNKSNRQSNKLTDSDIISGTVYNGIHVFWTLKDARKYKATSEIVVPIRCHAKDFVGKNGSHAVFTKVYLYADDYRKAANGESL